jgi:DNA primase
VGLYTSESVERVKEAIDIVELVGARTDLRRVGSRHQGLCPFHDERTPSFSVDADRKLYHCFGCGESGDAITFVSKTEALDFRGAIEWLADRYGIELKREREDPRAEERRRRRERLLALVERAAAYYARYLWDSAEAGRAREYLAARGLGEEVLRDFRVGYAPQAADRVVLAAQRDGFRPEEIAAAGLGQQSRSGGFHDRFRGRIVFPLADPRGRVLGFGARALRPEQRPKYLNTSENELYHKGRQLFGIDRARAAAAKAGRVIVVEGYTDVLALHQAGMRETVAIMGTALTQEQLAELSRAAPAVYLALDADRAGRQAMLRAAKSASAAAADGDGDGAGVLGAARSAEKRGVDLRIVPMPEGTDPAELVSTEGVEAFARLLDDPLSVPEFEARSILDAADLASAHGRDRAWREVQPVLQSVQLPASRDKLVRFVADKLDVDPSHVISSARQPAPAPAADPGGTAVGRSTLRVDLVQAKERAFLSMCLAQRDEGRAQLERLEDGHLSSDALRRVRDWLREHFDDPLAGLPSDDPELHATVTDLTFRAEEEPSSPAVLRTSFLELERRRIERALRRAESDGDLARQQELARALFSVREQYERAYRETE